MSTFGKVQPLTAESLWGCRMYDHMLGAVTLETSKPLQYTSPDRKNLTFPIEFIKGSSIYTSVNPCITCTKSISRLEWHPSSSLRFRGCSRGTQRAFCGSRADSSGTYRVFCGSGADSSAHFEPDAPPGRARAAIWNICGTMEWKRRGIV